MKRIIIAVIAVLMSITAFSQEHMKFKGIEIDGTTAEFAQKLTTVGFKIMDKSDNIYALEGVFSGNEATIYVYPNSKGIVNKVVVMYDVRDLTWKIIKSRYENLENGLLTKYGKPHKTVKHMDVVYKDGSGREIMGFQMEKNEYNTSWMIEGSGVIALMFQSTHQIPSSILLFYQDALNSVEDEQQAYDDL